MRFYQFKGLKEAQLRFDEWRQIYNHERPHEGIGMKCPVQRYTPSPRPFLDKPPEIVYEDGDELRKVAKNGVIDFKGQKYGVGQHFYGEYVAVRPRTRDGEYTVYFSKTRLININLNR